MTLVKWHEDVIGSILINYTYWHTTKIISSGINSSCRSVTLSCTCYFIWEEFIILMGVNVGLIETSLFTVFDYRPLTMPKHLKLLLQKAHPTWIVYFCYRLNPQSTTYWQAGNSFMWAYMNKPPHAFSVSHKLRLQEMLIILCLMTESLLYWEVAEDFGKKHSMLCSEYMNLNQNHHAIHQAPL